MNFIKHNYSLVSMLGSLLVGIIVFFISFEASKKDLIGQTSNTIEMVTRVKWQLMDRKLYSLEQQLNLLSENDNVRSLLSSETGKIAPKTNPQFDEYIKSLLYNQGTTNMLLIRQSGEIVYSINPSLDQAIPDEVLQFAQRSATDSAMVPKIISNKKEPYQFYYCKQIKDANGIRGALCMEIPREFLSIELRNTISLDSLSSYLISNQRLDQMGKVSQDTCVTCTWDEDYILFSPDKKIRETWSLLSVYPVSQINIQHIRYASMLNGMIAFFVAIGAVMVIIYSIQTIQKAKGITHGDILLVQTTWNTVSEYSTKVIVGFYKHLFAAAPEIKPMFKSEQAEQEKRMASMINTIVNSADSLEEFKGSISQLAKKHVHMGVKREYFPIVVKAIISSVEDQYGKGFTPAHRKSWYKILNRVSAIMIEEMESYQRTLKHAAP